MPNMPWTLRTSSIRGFVARRSRADGDRVCEVEDRRQPSRPSKMMLQGVHIITTQNAPGAPHSRDALLEYRDFLKAMHRSLDVKRIDDQLAQATPQPCANCTVSVNSLSNALR